MNMSLTPTILTILVFSGSCTNKQNFNAATKRPSELAATQAAEEPPKQETIVEYEAINDIVLEQGNITEFSSKSTLTASRENHIWIATTAGNAYYFKLQGNEIATQKKWTGLNIGGGGIRTYVMENGVALARSGGHIFYIDRDNTPEGALDLTNPQSYRKFDDIAGGERSCLVSYKKGGKRYLGFGYGQGNFIEMKVSDEPPFAPDLTKIVNQVQIGGGTTRWGYSCYIDQSKLIFYSQYYQGSPLALDLNNFTEVVPAESANNGKFTSNNLPDETVGAKGRGSYALSGDSQGNVFNGLGYYTFAYESTTKTVWGTKGGNLMIFPHDCFSKEVNCTGNAVYDLSGNYGITVGPLSSLNNGNMVGLVRDGNRGDVYLLKLKDPTKLDSGLEVTRIAEVEGNPYMYTDFTGATLYLTESSNTFNFAEQDGFDQGKFARGIGVTWSSKDKGTVEWKNISAKVRCFRSTEDVRPEFEEIAKMPDAGETMAQNLKSCIGKFIDSAEIVLLQQGNGNELMNISEISVSILQ